ncbi:MAG: diguanylate cyclase domain-containing protein [Methylobacter sp.]
MNSLILITLAVPLMFVINGQNNELIILENEKIGTAYIPKLETLNLLLAQHRGTANMLMNGDQSADNYLTELEHELEVAFDTAQQQCQIYQISLAFSCTTLEQIRSAWQRLVGDYRHLSESDSFKQHSQLISQIRKLQSDSADISNLSLDSMLISYYLMDNMVRTIPDLMESIGKLRGFGSGVAAQGYAKTHEKIELSKLIQGVQTFEQIMIFELHKVFNIQADLAPDLEAKLASATADVNQLLNVVDQKLINPSVITINDRNYFLMATNTINSVMSVYQHVVENLDSVLDARIRAIIWKRNLIAVGFLSLFIFVVIFIAYIYRRINTPLKTAIDGLQHITQGNYFFPVDVKYHDEMGYLLKSLISMRNQLHLATQVFSHIGEAMVVTDHENKITLVNKAFTEITGYTAAEVLNKNPNFLSTGRHDQAFYQKLWNSLLETGSWKGEIWNQRKDGEIYPEWLTITTIKDPEGDIVNHIGIFSDITERKNAEEKIAYLAHYDNLTGLINRITLKDRIDQALANAKRCNHQIAILFIDLDGFKAVNDYFGHAAGDEILKNTAKLLKSSLREQDTIARLGGDEFVVLLPEINDKSCVLPVAKKILTHLQQVMSNDKKILSVTPSIGISMYPADGSHYESLIANADKAMYTAKAKGRNNYQFFS